MSEELTVGQIRTILGPIFPQQLGICMVHEHLIIDAWDMWPVPNYSLIVDDVELVIEEVTRIARPAAAAIVDVTNIGLGRDPLALRRHITGHGGPDCDGVWLVPRTRLSDLHPGKERRRTGGDACLGDHAGG